MTDEQLYCARPECGKPFKKTTYNMKYCCTTCTSLATNQRLVVEYHRKNAIKNGMKRNCATCDTGLSRYNPKEVCAACEISKKQSHVGEAARLLDTVEWL